MAASIAADFVPLDMARGRKRSIGIAKMRAASQLP